MSRYIDADELIAICNIMATQEYAEIWHQFSALVMWQQTADVAEVRHGEWVFKFYCGNMSGYDYGMTCSVCGKPMYRQFAEKMPPYCPNCGARMDEVDE